VSFLVCLIDCLPVATDDKKKIKYKDKKDGKEKKPFLCVVSVTYEQDPEAITTENSELESIMLALFSAEAGFL
jgi:hypothetical protein